ncbi:MAG: superoxide dismutase [Archangium sp.]
MNFTLKPLPYAKNALVPHMSEETFSYHYDKHHAAYLTNLKGLIEGTPDADKSLEEIVKTSTGKVFNNAAQVWNHDFFWESMKPNGGGEPTGRIAELINANFGNYAAFKKAFTDAAVAQFGSGWAWLVKGGDALKIITTSNAETPLTKGVTPLITCDVWEHAYYVDYRNLRAKFVDVFLTSLINWDFATKNLG